MADKHSTLSDHSNNTNEKLINEASVPTEAGKKISTEESKEQGKFLG